MIGNNVTKIFFDRNWHKVEVQFGFNETVIYVDCHRAGSVPVVVPMRLLLNDSGNVECATYRDETKGPIVSY